MSSDGVFFLTQRGSKLVNQQEELQRVYKPLM